MLDYSTVYEGHQLSAVCLDCTRLTSIRPCCLLFACVNITWLNCGDVPDEDAYRLIVWTFFLASFGLLTWLNNWDTIVAADQY